MRRKRGEERNDAMVTAIARVDDVVDSGDLGPQQNRGGDIGMSEDLEERHELGFQDTRKLTRGERVERLLEELVDAQHSTGAGEKCDHLLHGSHFARGKLKRLLKEFAECRT